MSWTMRSRIIPPDRAGSTYQLSALRGRKVQRERRSTAGVPMSPRAVISRARRYSGKKRSTCATSSRTPAVRQAAIMRRPSPTVRAIGFSQITCLAAAAARRVNSACRCVGVQMSTTSTSAITASRSVTKRAAYVPARASPPAPAVPTKAAMRAPVWLQASAWTPPMRPVPTIATRMRHPPSWLFECARGESPDETPGEQHVRRQDRHHRQGQRRQDRIPVAEKLTDELLGPQRDRFRRFPGRQDQRKPQIIPDRNHREDRHRGHGGPHQREYEPEDPVLAHSIDPGGVLEIPRHLTHELLEDEDSQRQSLRGVDQD